MKRIYLSIIIFFLPLVCNEALSQDARTDRRMENIILDAVADLDANRYDDARRKLSVVTEVMPQNDAAHYYLALTEFFSGNYERALSEFGRAAELDRDNFWYRYRLAAAYAALGEKEKTAEIYTGLLKDFPKKNDLYYVLVELYLSMDRMEEALETLDSIDTVFGKNEISVMTRFDILRSLDRQKEAFEMLEAYNREYSSPQILSVLGDYQMSMYNDSTALAYYDEALEIASDYAPALLGKAEVYRMTRKYDDYFNSLRLFLGNKDTPSEGKGKYMTAVLQKTDPNFVRRFIPQLDSMISLLVSTHPADTTVNALAGIYHYQTGRKEEAKRFFRENVAIAPSSMGVAANYAEILVYTKDWDALAEHALASYDRFVEEPAFLEYAVVGYYNGQKYDEVLDVCGRMLAAQPADSARTVSAYSTMGDVYYLKNEKKKAYAAYDKVLKLNPYHINVLNNYAYYLSLDGRKLKKAYAMSRKTVEAEPDNPTYLDTFAWILYLQGKPQEAKPFFKHAMLYGGKESAVVLDHYAEVLYALGEYEMAFLYWNQALAKDKGGEVPALELKIKERKAAIKDKK